jgi:tetraacyldisaccharide 4'-kinase
MDRIYAHIGTGFVQPVLGAFAAAGHYRVLSRMALRDPHGLSVPVISVGNITFGGTAKTPMVEHITRMLKNQGFRPGIAIRGWGGRIDRSSASPEPVSDGKTVFLDWKDCGDEARLLAESLLDIGVPVAVGRDRVGAGQVLIERAGVDAILLDDGFQFTTLKRDFDLVLVDLMSPFGRFDGGIGLLREPISSISRADAVVLTRVESVNRERLDSLKTSLHARVDALPPLYTAEIKVRNVRDENGGIEPPYVLKNRLVLAFSGIANPLSFKITLKNLGCDICDFRIFPDHHPYSIADLKRISRRAVKRGADEVVTTTKDAVRLSGIRDVIGVPLKVVEIGLKIEDESRLFETMLDFSRTAACMLPSN